MFLTNIKHVNVIKIICFIGLVSSRVAKVIKPSNLQKILIIHYEICGGQSINRPIKVKIIGPVAHPRMQIRPRRPKSGRKGNH